MKLFDYLNHNLITVNALKPRSYFLPYDSFENSINNKPSIIDLNGEWDFSYYQSILDLEEKITNNKFKDKIVVPSCWQYHGYEKPFYVNNDYQFPFNPPMLPISTPVGLYHRCFDVDFDDKKNYVLTILGASSSTIYVNEQYCGYFEGTHNMHEFDVTRFLHKGKNDICFITYKWSNGSYLETQDMYRDNGIFRDVYISVTNHIHVVDYKINTKRVSNTTYSFELDVETNGGSNVSLSIKLFNKENKLVIDDTFKNHFSKQINVKEWNAEIPYLYSMYITLIKGGKELECIKDNVGFKTIDIKDGVFLINNTPIKIKGVNYHESTPDNGFYVPKEVFKKDIEIIKSLNINTIRFSHYPTSPHMIDLCEEYGLYVISEADIETYGCLATSNKDFVSSNSLFKERFIDRVTHLYERDKNSCSTIMWSIGNESGIGDNLDKAYEYLHNVSDIPVQYETCFRSDYDSYFVGKRRGYDIVSIMYPDMIYLNNLNNQNDSRPFYMCEYMHSMGLGPGEMQDMWDYIYTTPRLIGGCIWEYADHANVLEDNIDLNNRKYIYGGDNGEYIHDGNFCADGIVLPDRRLSTSAKEIKNIYRPFLFKRVERNIYIKNTNSFKDSIDYSFKVTIYKNGIIFDEKYINVYIKPQEEKQFDAFLYDDGEYSYVVETIENGNCMGIDNFIFGSYSNYKPLSKIKIGSDGIAVGETYRAKFDFRTRTLSSIVINNKEIICDGPINCGYGDFDKNKKGFIPSIFRAPIDNDRYVKDEWLTKLYDKMWVSFYDTNDSENKLTQEGIFSPGKYEAMFDIKSEYEFYSDSIKISFKIKARYDISSLPRFGVRLQINKEFNNITYYGLGPNENYPDFKSSCYLKEHKSNINDLNEYYIKPQDNGNRMENRFVRFINDNNEGFEISCDSTFLSFQAHDYALEDLTAAKHDFEIVHRNFIEVSINGFLRGVGSQSCGPCLNDKYTIKLKKGEELGFSFYLKPIRK